MKMNLSNGFLLLRDWYPMLRALPGDSLKELLLALIDRQQYGTPMPHFSDPQCEIFFGMIEPTIERRITGQKGGRETQKRNAKAKMSVDGTGATLPSIAEQSIAEQSIAEQSIEKQTLSLSLAERSVGEGGDADVADAPPPPLLSEKEKEKLISLGVPKAYVERRLARAQDYSGTQGKSVARVIMDWWEQDRALPASPCENRSRGEEKISFDCRSFDTDDFFRAALKKSLGENFDAPNASIPPDK